MVSRTIVNNFSFAQAFQYAHIYGYEYSLIDWKRLEFQLDEWHGSWYVLDAARQSLLNKSISLVLFVGVLNRVAI
jgi:hypothetical protein